MYLCLTEIGHYLSIIGNRPPALPSSWPLDVHGDGCTAWEQLRHISLVQSCDRFTGYSNLVIC